MKVVTALLSEPARSDAAAVLTDVVLSGLARAPDICVLFASPQFTEELSRLAPQIHERLGPRAFVGMSVEAVICGDREFEGEPALVLWAATLPGARVHAFHLTHEALQSMKHVEELREQVGCSLDDGPQFVLLGDPFSVNATATLTAIERAYPGCAAIGGMASAGSAAGENTIVFEGQALHGGLTGLALTGDVRFRMLVSQGCRPIGQHLVVTRAERNVIQGLGGRTPRDVVLELLQSCPQRDRKLAESRGLFLGRVINEYQSHFGRGDFLIRNPIGFDESGAMAINDLIRPGQTVQFHVRDSESASDDLESMLGDVRGAPFPGALLFTCNGRGRRLFAQPHHDARAITDACATTPLAGAFCAGEIGPVGGRNYVHGFSASVGLLQAPPAGSDE